ncbi:MAG: hypothetical protein JKY88_02555 [Pseudomonadales bacterium]|nr:hypothetical protein [Pseudomonadales bacterium]MBL4867528.1 hypothetical protein [Pseudomonadales bacterium]MBL4867803.1 hypothetical protein [Pseudomonadales bacterium]
MPQSKTAEPDWMQQEEQRADELAQTGQTSNPDAPQLSRTTRAPERMQKGLYIQPKYAHAFEDFVTAQRRAGKGMCAPELAEEMIKDLLIKYGADVSSL